MAHFRVSIDPKGQGTVEVNGVDISNAVAAVRVTARVGEATELDLSVYPEHVDFEGFAAIVEMISARDGDDVGRIGYLDAEE